MRRDTREVVVQVLFVIATCSLTALTTYVAFFR